MPNDKCRQIYLSKPSTLLTSKDMALKAERHLSQGSLTTLLEALPFWVSCTLLSRTGEWKLQLDDDIPHTRTNIYWEAWASQKIWILWEAMILSILIPCDSVHMFHPDFGLVQSLKDLHRYRSAPPSGVASMKNALFGVSCTSRNMFFGIKSKLPMVRNWRNSMGFGLQLKSCLCVLLRRAPQLCHHKCFQQKWWRGKSPNHAIVRSPAGQVRTVTEKNGGLSKIAALFITISSISSVVSKSIPHFRRQF